MTKLHCVLGFDERWPLRCESETRKLVNKVLDFLIKFSELKDKYHNLMKEYEKRKKRGEGTEKLDDLIEELLNEFKKLEEKLYGEYDKSIDSEDKMDELRERYGKLQRVEEELRSLRNPEEAVLYVPKREKDDPCSLCAEERSNYALEQVKEYLGSKNIAVNAIYVSPHPKDIFFTISVMSSRIEPGDVLCLSGGMRFLNLALFTAALATDPDAHDKILVYLEPEGRPRESQFLKLSDFSAMIALAVETNITRKLVLYALSKLGGEATLAEIHRTVRQLAHGYIEVMEEDIEKKDKKELLEVAKTKERVRQILNYYIKKGVVEKVTIKEYKDKDKEKEVTLYRLKSDKFLEYARQFYRKKKIPELEVKVEAKEGEVTPSDQSF